MIATVTTPRRTARRQADLSKMPIAAVEGYCCLWNVPFVYQGYQRAFTPGCFTHMGTVWRPVSLLREHRWDDLLADGTDLFLEEDALGLRFKAFLSGTPINRRVVSELKAGILTQCSLGYDDWSDATPRASDPGYTPITQARLREISLVACGAQQGIVLPNTWVRLVA